MPSTKTKCRFLYCTIKNGHIRKNVTENGEPRDIAQNEDVSSKTTLILRHSREREAGRREREEKREREWGVGEKERERERERED